MTTLVTGATGLVGSAVMRRLVSLGRRTRVLIRSGSDMANLQGLDVEVVSGSLTDNDSLFRAVEGCDALIHVAADYRLWVPDPAPMMAVNVEGTRLIMRAALEAGVKRIVHTSSVATLGLTDDGTPADEATSSTEADMIGPYKQSKFLAEELVREMAAAGLPAVIVNPSTPIGPGDVRPTPTGRVIVEAANGRMPAYVDTGLNIVHVDDVAEGHLLALEKGRVGERYILGGEDRPLGWILAEIARICGRRPPRVRLPHAAVLPIAAGAEAWARLTGREPFATVDGVRMAKKWMYFSSAKARAELGYTWRPASEALADAVAWFRQRGLIA